MKVKNMNLPPNESDLFPTADLGIATFLITKGLKLIRTAPQGPGRLLFLFKKTSDTERLVVQFLNETGQAPAKKLFQNYRSLRALAFAQTNNSRSWSSKNHDEKGGK